MTSDHFLFVKYRLVTKSRHQVIQISPENVIFRKTELAFHQRLRFEQKSTKRNAIIPPKKRKDGKKKESHEKWRKRKKRKTMLVWLTSFRCRLFRSRQTCPTDPFPILEPRNPSIDKVYVALKRRSTDFEALKLWRGRSWIWNNWHEFRQIYPAVFVFLIKRKEKDNSLEYYFLFLSLSLWREHAQWIPQRSWI